MTALVNPKHERFAQELAGGASAADAYITAGFKANRSNAANFARKPVILDRVSEILAERDKIQALATAEAIRATGIDKEWVLMRLKEVAERCLQHQPVVRNGDPVMVETPDGNIAAAYRFDAAGANRALELLGKEQGMFIDKKEVAVKPGNYKYVMDLGGE